MNVMEPFNFKEANEHVEWRNSMKEEYDFIIKNDTWELAKLPNDKVPIGSKWFFKIKFNSNKAIDKYKSNL